MTRSASPTTPFVVASGLAVTVMVLGGLFTELGPWYRALVKPAWQPPGYLFGPVWFCIFALIAASAAIAWREATSGTQRAWLVGLFALNGVLNAAWSYLFFQLQRPDWAFIEVIALWLSIASLILVTRSSSARASMLLAPYIGWVSFAAFLNYTVVALNRPFG